MGRVILGCAGFPVPATRYFKEFPFVEIQETHIAVPGMGTVRRWRREAPAEFPFAMLAPREIGQEGFREGKVVETALKSFLEVGKELEAKIAVFVVAARSRTQSAEQGGGEGVPRRAFGRSSIASCGRRRRRGTPTTPRPSPRARRRSPRAIRSCTAVVQARRVLPAAWAGGAQEPLRRSGDREARRARTHAKHKDATYVFTNVDMFADAKRFKKAAKL